MEETLMITPPPSWAIICLPAHLQPKKTPLTLIWITVFQPLTLMSSGLARNEAPALLTMMSSRPISFAVRSTSALTASSWRTSRASQKERRPSLVISATTGSRFSFLRLQITTSAPALANSMAMERPMPTPPPVTMATFFSSENGDAAMVPPGCPLSSLGRGSRVTPLPLGGEGRVKGVSRTRGLYPSWRRRALEAHGLATARGDEAEAGCVQAEPAELAPGAAVLPIADDGMTDGGQLHADLPPAPRAEEELEARRVLPSREHPVARDRCLAFGPARGVDAEVPVLDQPALEPPRLPAHVAFHQRDVGSLDGARLELVLEAPLGFRRLGEDEEPGCLAVEAMDDEGPRARPLRREVVPEEAVGGALALALSRHGEQPRRLVHDDEGLVLVDEAQAFWKGHAAAPAQLDAVLGAHHGAPVAGDAPVDLHAARLEPLLETPAGGVGKKRAQTFRQRRLAHSPRSTPSGLRPRSRKVPRKPTASANSVAPATPETTVSGEPPQSISSAQWPMLHASAVASIPPQRPAATPRSAYSTAETRATAARVWWRSRSKERRRARPARRSRRSWY